MRTGDNIGGFLADEIVGRKVPPGNFTHLIPSPNACSETRCLGIRNGNHQGPTVCEAGLPREIIRGRTSSVENVTGKYVTGSTRFVRVEAHGRWKGTQRNHEIARHRQDVPVDGEDACAVPEPELAGARDLEAKPHARI